ncbi:MAG: hypothetical protein HC847_29835 [Hydrococcus sp. RU_2_2]|nr:hypothetical protein [Hydrococcus sp. RU_2_2]NJP21859.1 hypothetical protein [Hydrococcus sp. CRU_1_1]
MTQPNYSEPIVQNLSKVGDLIFQSKKLENTIKFKQTKIWDLEFDFSEAISNGAIYHECEKHIEQIKQELIQLKALKNSLDNLIFLAIGDSLRARATEEFKQQTDRLTQKVKYDRRQYWLFPSLRLFPSAA